MSAKQPETLPKHRESREELERLGTLYYRQRETTQHQSTALLQKIIAAVRKEWDDARPARERELAIRLQQLKFIVHQYQWQLDGLYGLAETAERSALMRQLDAAQEELRTIDATLNRDVQALDSERLAIRKRAETLFQDMLKGRSAVPEEFTEGVAAMRAAEQELMRIAEPYMALRARMEHAGITPTQSSLGAYSSDPGKPSRRREGSSGDR